jgi:hypothetical protein
VETDASEGWCPGRAARLQPAPQLVGDLLAGGRPMRSRAAGEGTRSMTIRTSARSVPAGRRPWITISSSRRSATSTGSGSPSGSSTPVA